MGTSGLVQRPGRWLSVARQYWHVTTNSCIGWGTGDEALDLLAPKVTILFTGRCERMKDRESPTGFLVALLPTMLTQFPILPVHGIALGFQRVQSMEKYTTGLIVVMESPLLIRQRLLLKSLISLTVFLEWKELGRLTLLGLSERSL